MKRAKLLGLALMMVGAPACWGPPFLTADDAGEDAGDDAAADIAADSGEDKSVDAADAREGDAGRGEGVFADAGADAGADKSMDKDADAGSVPDASGGSCTPPRPAPSCLNAAALLVTCGAAPAHGTVTCGAAGCQPVCSCGWWGCADAVTGEFWCAPAADGATCAAAKP